MKVLFAASEAAPYIKSGGLGDVIGSLPNALNQKKCEVSVILPLHEGISQDIKDKMIFVSSIFVKLAWRKQYCGIFKLENDGVNWYFIDNEYYFKRGDLLYGCYDDAERFAFFSLAVLESLPFIGAFPDIIHCHDWQTALIPVYLKLKYYNVPKYSNIKTVFTIHNIEYQGVFGKEIMENVLGISNKEFDNGFLEHKGAVNFMKSAINCADRITTVSPTYAREIQTKEYAHSLDGILQYECGKLSGILNGIDQKLYNPETDKHLFVQFSEKNPEQKLVNKQKLLKLVNLPQKKSVPLIAMVSRLVSHKGLDLVAAIIDELLSDNVALIILGTGEWKYEQFLRDKQKQYPCKLSVNIAFNTDLAQKVYGGSDLFLMPSKSEPCGLAQMIALKYGTIPIVRETGGLKDTVISYNSFSGEGNGFSFSAYNAHDMLHVIRDACKLYSDKQVWEKLVLQGLTSDFSWQKSAKEYIELYRALLPVKV